MKTTLAMLAMFLGACGGFCGAGPDETEATLFVTDAVTGEPIPEPLFMGGTEELNVSCQELNQARTLCTSWLLVGPAEARTVTVTASGYHAVTVDVDTTQIDSIHVAVQMQAL